MKKEKESLAGEDAGDWLDGEEEESFLRGDEEEPLVGEAEEEALSVEKNHSCREMKRNPLLEKLKKRLFPQRKMKICSLEEKMHGPFPKDEEDWLTGEDGLLNRSQERINKDVRLVPWTWSIGDEEEDPMKMMKEEDPSAGEDG